MDENKTSMYLVAIVGIVAAVGIFVLLMGAGVSGDVTGQAFGGFAGIKAKDDAVGLASGIKEDNGFSPSGITVSSKGVADSADCSYPTCCAAKPICEKMKSCVTAKTCSG